MKLKHSRRHKPIHLHYSARLSYALLIHLKAYFLNSAWIGLQNDSGFINSGLINSRHSNTMTVTFIKWIKQNFVTCYLLLQTNWGIEKRCLVSFSKPVLAYGFTKHPHLWYQDWALNRTKSVLSLTNSPIENCPTTQKHSGTQVATVASWSRQAALEGPAGKGGIHPFSLR